MNAAKTSGRSEKYTAAGSGPWGHKPVRAQSRGPGSSTAASTTSGGARSWSQVAKGTPARHEYSEFAQDAYKTAVHENPSPAGTMKLVEAEHKKKPKRVEVPSTRLAPSPETPRVGSSDDKAQSRKYRDPKIIANSWDAFIQTHKWALEGHPHQVFDAIIQATVWYNRLIEVVYLLCRLFCPHQ